jgi:hypothetical protein
MLDPRDLVLEHNLNFTIKLNEAEYQKDSYYFLEISEYA